MSYDVIEGGLREEFERRKSMEELAMIMGHGKRTIFLNGGSDTRKNLIEFWSDYARDRNIRFSCRGNCVIEVGGSKAAMKAGK